MWSDREYKLREDVEYIQEKNAPSVDFEELGQEDLQNEWLQLACDGGAPQACQKVSTAENAECHFVYLNRPLNDFLQSSLIQILI